MSTLTPNSLREILQETFPKNNDFTPGDFLEELNELAEFGVRTDEELKELLSKQYEAVMAADKEELDEEHIHWYTDELGADVIKERIEGGYWFALQGLLRIALELEFGDAYIEFAEKRDGI